jgi:hypothetical protein
MLNAGLRDFDAAAGERSPTRAASKSRATVHAAAAIVCTAK